MKKGTYGREVRLSKASISRKAVVDAVSEAWRDGDSVTIAIRTDGDVKITKNAKCLGYYRSVEEFIRDFMPEILK